MKSKIQTVVERHVKIVLLSDKLIIKKIRFLRTETLEVVVLIMTFYELLTERDEDTHDREKVPTIKIFGVPNRVHKCSFNRVRELPINGSDHS